jgi:hypothetical protein
MIFLFTLTHPLIHLMSNATQVQTHIGKYLLHSGRPFFIALNRASRSEKLQEIMVSRMRQYGASFAQLKAKFIGQT